MGANARLVSNLVRFMAVKELNVSSISELVKEVLTLSTSLGKDDPLWFRGESCSSFDLQPSLLRDRKTSDEVYERERRLITRFRQRGVAYWPEGIVQDDWSQLFAMQHYGIPTRLLDWSENLFVATYFALSAKAPHGASCGCKPVIWCMDPVRWNRKMPGLSEYGDSIRILTTADDELENYRPDTNKRRLKSPVAMYGSHNSNRIVAQRGTFMVWGGDVSSMKSFGEDSPEDLLIRIVIEGDRSDLFEEVKFLGFDETMIFPELPSLASELKRTEGWRS